MLYKAKFVQATMLLLNIRFAFAQKYAHIYSNNYIRWLFLFQFTTYTNIIRTLAFKEKYTV